MSQESLQMRVIYGLLNILRKLLLKLRNNSWVLLKDLVKIWIRLRFGEHFTCHW